MIRMLGALGLFGLTLSSGCVTEDDASGTYHPVDGIDGAMAKSMNPGASIEDCLNLIVTGDTGWDTSSFGGTEAWCLNRDEDEAFDVNSSDPFADGCICLIAGTLPSEYAQVDETTVLIEDCDDEDAAVTGADVTAYTDADSDGYGDDASATLVCGLDSGMSTTGGDCDDGTWATNPDATEICDDVDNNCDGMTDADDDDVIDAQFFYEDDDADGYGNPDSSVIACELPEPGYVGNDDDCDDADASTSPDALEVCDGADNNCDGFSDDADDSVLTLTGSESWPDADGDGYGDMDVESTWSCVVPTGAVENDTDCDDGDAGANPGATEIADDGIDQDCDGSDLETSSGDDADGDGFDSEASGGTDCDDTDAAVNPDATEISLNLVDDNCDGAANVSDTIQICATPESELSTFEWELWLRDGTVYPDGNDDPDWSSPGYADGIGELCADFTVIDGNTLVLNGPFDIDGDGTAGEEYVDGDGVWLAMNDGTHYSGDITGDGVVLSLTSTSWGAGSDLIEVDIDLL